MVAPELKARWVAALRSGEYRQTTQTLKDEGGFCCLGVLCKVAGDEIAGLGARIEEAEDRLSIVLSDDDGDPFVEDDELPDCVELGLGFTGGQANKLAEMNDGSNGRRQHSFAEIAAHIEEHL